MSKLWKIIALVTVCSALAAALLFVNSRARKTVIIPQDPSTLSSSSQEVMFRLTTIFDGRTNDGERYANSFYKASDCVSLSEVVVFFNSTDRAQRELISEAEKASVLVDRTAVVNSEGQQIGERVVLKFNETEKQKSHAQVAWTSDNDFHSISGSSLEHLLQFEKALSTRNGKISAKIDNVQEVTFTASESNHGRSEGFDYSEQQFRSSDCETVTVRSEFFTSPKHAEEELVKRLKSATTILERGRKPKATTEQNGRVVATFTAPTQSEQLEDTMILWTSNAELHSIKGTMLHVLEFEKRNYR